MNDKRECLVASLKTCRQLAEAGVAIKEPLFWWVPGQPNGEWQVAKCPTGDFGVPAWTAQEVADVLPVLVRKDGVTYGLRIERGYTTYESMTSGVPPVATAMDRYEANHRAMLLLDLHNAGILPDRCYPYKSESDDDD